MGMTIREREEQRRKRGIGNFITSSEEVNVGENNESVQVVEIKENKSDIQKQTENEIDNNASPEFTENKKLNEKKLVEPKTKKDSEKPEYVHKSYYIRPDQFKKVNVEAASTGIDKSEIVRQALDAYFAKKDEQ